MKKNIIIIILSILVTLLIIYIIYDKVISDKELKLNIDIQQEKLTIDNDNQNNRNEIKEDSNNNNIETSKKEENYTEEEVINYFEVLNTEISTYNNDEIRTKTIKEKFVKCIDFIFYEGEIGGKTFKELTNSAKLKILEISMSIDSKIDTKFPGYKESINNKYQDIKGNLVKNYLDTTTNICNESKELCINAKEDFQNLKDNFGLTWDTIKTLAGAGLTKLTDWYEIWK